MVFSLGLHGLLGVILLGSAGFGSRPQQMDLQILTMIPANIVDRAGAGGGTRMVNPTPEPPAQPRAQAPSQPQPPPQPAHVEQAQSEPVHAKPLPRSEPTHELPVPDDSKELAMDSKPKSSKHPPRHEVKPTYTLAHATTTPKKHQTDQSSPSQSSARAEARRRKEIENALADLASGVRSSGSPNAIVDTEGIGGGEAFAGYRNAVYSAYYHAFRPDDAASRQSVAEAKVTVASDGSIIVAELVHPSGDIALDRSVERALHEVTKLPAFPASAQDTQRTFVIRFSPEAKEMSG
ncbi:MAG TPA: TonB C-terminal domain-containing protein [Candidatus Cybelea sp.]|nr:TonB C-terminal domain-containing protein [Candidatus Cybelea sp.]